MKRVKLDVEIIASDDISDEQITDRAREELASITDDEEYAEVVVLTGISRDDRASEKIFDLLDAIRGEDIDKAKDIARSIEEDDE